MFVCVYAVGKPNSDALCKYVAGYNECAAQVTHYLTSLHKDDADGNRGSLTDNACCCLLDHLADTLHQSSTAASAVSSQHVVNPQTTVDQSAPSSAVYVISPQQVPVTSSTSPAPAQLRMLPASLNGGPLVLLLTSSSPAQHQHATEHEHSERDSCDVMADSVSGCSGDEILPKYKTERHDANNQSESSPGTSDQQQNTYDLHMWRPW